MFQTLIFPGQLYFTTGKKLRFSYYNGIFFSSKPFSFTSVKTVALLLL